MLAYLPFCSGIPEQRARKLRFVHWLKTHGFLVVTKDGAPSGDGQYKADVDLLMVIDCLELCSNTSPRRWYWLPMTPDFAHLAVTLRRRGYRVEVAALESGLGGISGDPQRISLTSNRCSCGLKACVKAGQWDGSAVLRAILHSRRDDGDDSGDRPRINNGPTRTANATLKSKQTFHWRVVFMALRM